jgi:hypothetical protein
MSAFVCLYENFADDGIFVSGFGSWTLPLTNLQTADINQVARSSSATNTSTKFKIDLGNVSPVDGLAFGPCNLSPGATWQWRGYSDAAYTSLIYDSGVQTISGEVVDWTDTASWLEWEDSGFWLGISDFAQFSELPQFFYHITPITKSAEYWLLEIFDTANSDGFVEIGRLVIARAFRPSNNYSEGNSTGLIPLTDVEESLGGLRSYFERGLRRTFQATFPRLPESELFNDVFRLMLRAGISKQVFIVPDPDDDSFGQRRSFLATLKQPPVIQQLLLADGSTALEFEEVL